MSDLKSEIKFLESPSIIKTIKSSKRSDAFSKSNLDLCIVKLKLYSIASAIFTYFNHDLAKNLLKKPISRETDLLEIITVFAGISKIVDSLYTIIESEEDDKVLRFLKLVVGRLEELCSIKYLNNLFYIKDQNNKR